uniref:Methyltransferase-like protein 4 n=1 Tax=Globodera pallida TaxID=36090 RepID=A0A183BPW7_GLOPA
MIWNYSTNLFINLSWETRRRAKYRQKEKTEKEGTVACSRRRRNARFSLFCERHLISITKKYFNLQNCRHVRSLFEKFKSTFKSFDDANNQRNNEIARRCVKMAPLFHHSVLFADGSGLLETVKMAESVKMANCPLLLSSPAHLAATDGEADGRDNAAILCSNTQNCPLLVDSCIIPPKSSFLLGDVALTRHFLSREFDKFDFIVADPPWPNRTVKRQRTYQMFRAGKLSLDHPLDRLGQLPIPQILADGALFCIWLSNSRTAHTVAHELLDKWKMRKLAQWHWLKDWRTNTAKWEKIPSDFCVVSVPNANPSRKPPISLLLQQLGFICPVKNGLELYARYLLPNFTSVGYEATKFQHQYYFNSINHNVAE